MDDVERIRYELGRECDNPDCACHAMRGAQPMAEVMIWVGHLPPPGREDEAPDPDALDVVACTYYPRPAINASYRGWVSRQLWEDPLAFPMIAEIACRALDRRIAEEEARRAASPHQP